MENPKQKKDDWLADMFTYGQGLWVWAALILVALFAGLLLPSLMNAKERPAHRAVIYCAQDQVFAEPLFREFTASSGIAIAPVFDSEAVKTVGLANRLLAEKSHPQCDVFWSNEEFRTRQLAAAGVFRETNGWAAFGYRSRRIVINTNKVALAEAPRTLDALTNAAWRGRVAMAYPTFGTTATHVLALRQHWGATRWEAWCRALNDNCLLLVEGNSLVVKFVARGEAWIGLTDSDDIAAGQREGLPVAMLPLTEEMLLIPNTVAVVRGSPHPEAAQRVFDFLRQPDTLDRLIVANALEGRSPDQVGVATLKPDWDAMLRDLDAGVAKVKEIFVR